MQHCKSVPVGCKDVLSPLRLVKRTDVNCPTYKASKQRYNDNLCLLRAIRMHKTGTKRLEEETSKLLNQKLDINAIVTAEKFRGVSLEVLDIVERLAEVNFLVSVFQVSDNGTLGQLAEQTLRRFNPTANLLRYNFHICYVTDVNKVFKWFRCSTCDNFLDSFRITTTFNEM